MKTRLIQSVFLGGMLGIASTMAGDPESLIADAESAAPASVTSNATIKAGDGTILREGTNEFTCYPGSEALGAMCNPPEWDRMIGALMNKEDFQASEMAISYMLAGEGDALGVSNSNPYHPDPVNAEDHVKEGPHLMILVPDNSILEGMSRDPSDPVYVMWGDTPYAHIMVRISENQAE